MALPELNTVHIDVCQQEWRVPNEKDKHYSIDPWFVMDFYVHERLGEENQRTPRVLDAISQISNQNFSEPNSLEWHVDVSRRVIHDVTEAIAYDDIQVRYGLVRSFDEPIEILLNHAVRNNDFEMEHLFDRLDWFEENAADVRLLKHKHSWQSVRNLVKKADPHVKDQLYAWIDSLGNPMFSPELAGYDNYISRVRNLVSTMIGDFRYRDDTQSGFTQGVENSVDFLLYNFGQFPGEHRMDPRSADSDTYPLV